MAHYLVATSWHQRFSVTLGRLPRFGTALERKWSRGTQMIGVSAQVSLRPLREAQLSYTIEVTLDVLPSHPLQVHPGA